MRSAIARFLRSTSLWAVALVLLGQAGVALSQAPDTVIFGPKQYVRGAGPDERVETFSVPAGIAAPFVMRVQSGNPDGAQRATSGEIVLNGVEYVRERDFNNDVSLIERNLVNVQPSNNRLDITIKGQPGSRYTITILGRRIQPVPTKLAPDPLNLFVGAAGQLTATLAPAPTAPGVLAVASADPGVASVPPSVSFAAGQTEVAIPVTGVAFGSTTVGASLNGTTSSATIQVTPAPPTVTTLAPATLTVTQGASGTLTVSISSAQTTGVQVALASDNPAAASVAASVTVPAGQVSAPVQVTGVAPGSASITASLNGSSASSQVTVHAVPPTVVSLLPALSTVNLGASTAITLTISAAQAADVSVPLLVTPPGIVSAPDTVVVPAGQTSGSIPIGTIAYGQAGITATLNGSSASAVVNVVPPPLAVTALEPATLRMNVGATSQFTVRINAAQLTNTDIALSVDDASVLQVPATVTIAQGQTSAVFTVTGLATGNVLITASGNGTQQTASVHVSPQPAAIVSLLPNPLPLQQGANGTLTLTINVAQEVDTIVDIVDDAPTVVQAPASVTVAAGSTSAQVLVRALIAGSAQITASVNGTSASSIVEVVPPPPVVTSVTPATLTTPKGTPGTLRVSVSRAPSAVTAVSLVSSAPDIVSVPDKVNIPAGALFADFPVAANAVGQATVTASLNGGSASSTVTVTPAELVTLVLSPQQTSAYTDETVQYTAFGTMTDGTTQDFTTLVTWSSSDPTVATVSNTGLVSGVASGTTIITATYGFVAAATGQSVTITVSTTLTLKPLANLVLTAPTTTLSEGDSTTVTITSLDPAPAGGLVVALSATGTGAGAFPPTATIAEGAASTTFTFAATVAGTVTVTGTALHRLPGWITFTIQPRLRIDTVTPASGEVESTITLSGSGFDPAAANNQLTFPGINGTSVSATPLTATPVQITVRVPALADSGPITLTNSRGTTQSPPFTVTREQDYQLVASPASVTVPQGASGAAQVQLASTGTKAYTGLVTLSATGLPSGVTASFAPAATLSAFQTGAVTFGAIATAAPGTYAVTLNASATEAGKTFTRSTSVNIVVIAAANVTGVKGRFVTPDNVGIAGVIVRADIATTPQPTTTTDAAGNFLLTGLPAGPISLKMDATPANPLYPIWPYIVTLIANQITVMPDWIINPPPSDDKFKPIAQNSAVDQIITDDRFPGLEIKIPAGVQIVGWDGVVKSRIAVERLEPDRLPVSPPPIPTKSVYQLYFGTPMGGIPSAPIPVTLPNDGNMQPGEQTQLWYYDGSPMGGTGEWKLGGTGTVSADGKVIVTDPGSGIPRFCGVCGLPCFVNNQNNDPPPPPPGGGDGDDDDDGDDDGSDDGDDDSDSGDQPGDTPDDPGTGDDLSCSGDVPQPSGQAAQKVTLSIGQELLKAQDLRVGGLVPLSLGRRFHPRDAFNNIANTTLSLGLGWALRYDVSLLPLSSSFVRLVLAGNDQVNFTPDGSGGFQNLLDRRFSGAVLRNLGSTWQLKFRKGRVWNFSQSGLIFLLTEQKDTSGNSRSISRGTNGKVLSVQGGQRSLSFTYGANGFVSQVKDQIGRTVSYTYNAQSRLDTVTAADGKISRYTYVDDSEFPTTPACTSVPGGVRLKTIQRAGQAGVQTLFYGPGHRVLRETLPNGEENRFSYTVVGACVTHVSNPNVACAANCPNVDSWDNFQAGWRFYGGAITTASLTDGVGQTKIWRFDARKLTASITNALGQTMRFARDPASSRVTRMTDALTQSSSFTYDTNGNLTSSTDALGRVVDMTYDAKWNKRTSITRHLEDGTAVTWQTAYDVNTGKVVSRTDPLGNVTSYAYTPQGQLQTLTLPGNRTTTYAYNPAGDLVSMKDPLGNETLYGRDDVGRLVKRTNSLGFDTQMAYNATDQLSQIIDAAFGLTLLNYDGRRNLASIVDPRGNTTESYQYDDLHRLTQKTDAAGKASLYQYDSSGNLVKGTDRRGQVSSFTYDARRRVARVDYPDAVQTRAYDSAGRVIEIRDGNTSIQYAYDAVNRIIKETTDNSAGRNEVGYTYDALDRVSARTVNGGDPTTYTYDKRGRPLTITYRGQTTAFDWDPVTGRLRSKTLPNGIVQERAYDIADRIVAINYKKADGTMIESVSYTYDAIGQRLSKTTSSGSSSQETPINATYDAANRLTTLTLNQSGQSFVLAYDGNGNLLSKTDQADPNNVTSYTWDGRNRLAGIRGPGIVAEFEYDALGRRASATVNGRMTAYIYDGNQALGEVSGGLMQAGVLSALAIDDVVARYTAQGARVYLTDALGSVLAVSKDDQSLQAFYGYTPYGESQVIGDDAGNPIQFAGRENDQTGLYYYRARYYDPVLKRFISEDPIGMLAGTNYYAYVGGNPNNSTDPYGLWPFGAPGRSQVERNAPGELQRLVPELTKEEAEQLSKDAIQELGWPDVAGFPGPTPSQPPKSWDDLTDAQKQFIRDFLDKLPARDKDAIEKVKKYCVPKQR